MLSRTYGPIGPAIASLALAGCIINPSDGDEGGVASDSTGSHTSETEETGRTDGSGESGESGDGDSSGDEDPYERPQGAREIISDEQLADLEEIGAVVYPGSDPPSIPGVYDRVNGTVTYHDDPTIIGGSVCFDLWTVRSTDSAEVYETSAEFYSNCTGTSEAQATYISGSGDCFTLYGAGSGEREGCEYESMGIVSGCVADGGLVDLHSAGIEGPRESIETGACETLIANKHIGAEGAKGMYAWPFAERIGDPDDDN